MRERGVVTAPDGTRWRVRRRWLERPVWGLRLRRRRRSPTADAVRDGAEAGFWSLPDPSGLLDGADDPLVGIVLMVGAVLLAALVAFVLLPLLGLALELAVPLVLLWSGLLGRVFLRRPWTIEAVAVEEPARRVAFAVVGWRRSRRALATLAATVATSGPPSALPEAEPAALGGAAPPA